MPTSDYYHANNTMYTDEPKKPTTLCDWCTICSNPKLYCDLIPAMEIYIEDTGFNTSHQFEIMEDAIAKVLGELGQSGRVESKVTGNTTTFGGDK